MQTERSRRTGEVGAPAALARLAFWQQWGKFDLGAGIGPVFESGPRWPALRRGWVVIRRRGSVIVATDGLSDPDLERPEYPAGHEGELFVEIGDRRLVEAPAAILAESVAVQALRQVADAIVEQDRSILDRHRRWGLHTMAITSEQAPSRWLALDGTLEVLIGKHPAAMPIELQLPTGPIRIAAITPMTPAEATAVALDWDGGARRAAAAAMDRWGSGHLFNLDRY